MIVKLAVVEGTLAAVIVAAGNTLDGTAEKVVLYAAAGAGLLWLWANVLRPAGKIVRRTAAAVDAFEDLPKWQKRLSDVEKDVKALKNGQAAIIRELGIEDQVRRMPPEGFGVRRDSDPPPPSP